jgi:hypothetical protein
MMDGMIYTSGPHPHPHLSLSLSLPLIIIMVSRRRLVSTAATSNHPLSSSPFSPSNIHTHIYINIFPYPPLTSNITHTYVCMYVFMIVSIPGVRRRFVQLRQLPRPLRLALHQPRTVGLCLFVCCFVCLFRKNTLAGMVVVCWWWW